MVGKFDVIEGGPKTISLVLVRLTTISFWAQLSSSWKNKNIEIKMYVYRCVRQSGYVLEFSRVGDDLYHAVQNDFEKRDQMKLLTVKFCPTISIRRMDWTPLVMSIRESGTKKPWSRPTGYCQPFYNVTVVLSLYLSRESSDYNEIWCTYANFAFKVGHTTKYQNFADSKWQTAAILEIVFRLYLDDLLSD